MLKRVAVVLLSFSLAYSLSFSRTARATTQQDSSQRPDAVKLRAAEVFVDAGVFDRKNRLVSGLTEQDFEVYEDGVLQDISSFRLVRGSARDPEKPEEDRSGAATAEAVKDALTLGRESPNLIIILLDYSTTQFQNQKLIQNAFTRYIKRKLQPGDLMAVFILGSGLRLLSDFTDDKDTLIAAVENSDLAGTAMAYDRSNLNATIAAGQAEQIQSQSISSSLETPSGIAAMDQVAAVRGQIDGLATAIMAQHLASLDIALRSGLDRRQSLGVLDAIRSIATGVRRIEGRKTLVLFSEGFVVGPSVEDYLNSVAGTANRSQLAIYCIDSQGLETRELRGDLVPRDELTTAISNSLENKSPRGGETVFDRARQVGRDIRESALRHLANSTGGLLINNTNDLLVGLERVDQEMRSYYLLSYQPKNEKMDGRFRQIVVRVKRPDLVVRARSGYFAIPPGYEALTPAEFQLLEQARGVENRIPLYLRVAGFQERGSQYRTPVIIEMPSTAIKFEHDQNKNVARLNILGIVRDRAGNLLKRFGGAVQVGVTEAEYRILRSGTVSFVNHLQLPAGDYYLFDVVVKDLSSGDVTAGQQAIYLRKPDTELSLSTILLATEVDREAGATADQFLAVKGAKILPSARCEFRNGDNLIFYFDIYHPGTEPQNEKTDLSVQITLTKDGHPVAARLPSYRVSEPAAGPVSHVTFSRYLKLNGLEPGDYTLIVSVRDALGKQSVRGQAGFTLIN